MDPSGPPCSAPCCGMSGCPSLWPWPRSCTTPQEDRGWPRPGRGISRCNTRPRSGRIPPLQAAGTLYYRMDVDDLPAAGGSQPDRLTEVRPQERVQRHTVEQIILAPMLDVPVPLMEEQLLVDAFAPHDIQVPEQVIEVPKILIDELSVRSLVREPQLAGQLVEVPTIISFSSLQRIVEQNVDIPVPRGGVRGLQGFPQDRLQQRHLSLWNAFLSRMWSRSLILMCLVEAFKIFVQHVLCSVWNP